MIVQRLLACWILALAAVPARASFLSGEALDTMADVLALVVLFLVPAVVIVLFWIVHVLPEEASHLREELEAMEARGALPPRLRGLKDELARLRADELEKAA